MYIYGLSIHLSVCTFLSITVLVVYPSESYVEDHHLLSMHIMNCSICTSLRPLHEKQWVKVNAIVTTPF